MCVVQIVTHLANLDHLQDLYQQLTIFISFYLGNFSSTYQDCVKLNMHLTVAIGTVHTWAKVV